MVQPVPSLDSVRAVAPGKINLVLLVGEPQADGYHPLVTCFHAVDVWETVTVTPADEYLVTISGDVNMGEVPLTEDNLVVKAAKAVAAQLGVDKKVSIHIDKRVPVGGGMGGGSADAAAALIAVDKLWGGGLSQVQLLDIAGTLGADVPFLLEGYSQLGRGNGGELEPVKSQPFWWVVVPAVHHLSTPLVYQTLDQQRGGQASSLPHDLPAAFRSALFEGNPERLAPLLINDLQAPALQLLPELETTLAIGRELGALAAMISGSGPTCVLLARNQEHQQLLVGAMTDRGYHAIAATSPARGAHLVEIP
jgi:4-diphosphocytidyl-2-C-methyl-D-erythritol kinase